MYIRADRDITKLAEPFQTKVRNFLNVCWNNGLDIFITEAVRTKKRQEYLYASGRTRYGPIVTWTLNSIHLTGNAIDIAFKGPELYPRDMNTWHAVTGYARMHGIEWSYDLWGVEKIHFQDDGTIPDTNYLNKYIMDLKFQQAVQNKLIDSIGSSLSALWNFATTKKEQDRISEIKKELLSYKD